MPEVLPDRPDPTRGLSEEVVNELALFAGAGGGILGGRILGWTTIGAVEIEEYPRRVLLQRMRDGALKPFPIWDDVSTFDGRPWRGVVDVISGGFPCQDISAAGKGAGIRGERSGLWGEMARIVGEVRPRYVLVENSPMLTSRGLGCVLGDLASLGYDARWGVLGARHAGAPHQRDRIWILACDPYSESEPAKSVYEKVVRVPKLVANSDEIRTQRRQCRKSGSKEAGPIHRRGQSRSPVPRVSHGVAHRMDRLRAIGNGQVPQCMALAWRVLGGGQ